MPTHLDASIHQHFASSDDREERTPSAAYPFLAGQVVTHVIIPLHLVPTDNGLEGDNLDQITALDDEICHIDRILALKFEWHIAKRGFRMTRDGLILSLERVRDDPQIEPITQEMFARVVDAIEARARQIELNRLPDFPTKPQELATAQATIDASRVPAGRLTGVIEQLARGEPLHALLPHGSNGQPRPLRLPPRENLRPNQPAEEESEHTGVVTCIVPGARRLELANGVWVMVPSDQSLSVFAIGHVIKYRDGRPHEIKRSVAQPSRPIEIVPPAPELWPDLPGQTTR